MLPLLILLTCAAGAAFMAIALGGWMVASRMGWLIGPDRAPRSTPLPFAIALAVCLVCILVAQDPAFWAVPR